MQLRKAGARLDVSGEGGSIIWPAPAPYQHTTPGCEAVLEAPLAPLPQWIIERMTQERELLAPHA
jgi:hypothetical protein